jgi:microcystin-dependent protein
MTLGSSAYVPGLVGPIGPSQEITNTTPKITLAPTPPGNPAQGDLWWSTVTGQTSVWYFDCTSYQWVIANYGGKEGPPGPPGAIGNIVAGVGLTGGGTTPVVDLAIDTTVVAPLASPAFTGTPTAPTPAPGDNTTKLPTTAFVTAAIAALNIASYAPINSPALTGNPTAPNAAPGDNTQSLATTAFVHAAIVALPPPPTTLPPSGAAGGDLAGNFPNPTIKANVGLTGVPTAPSAAQNTDTSQVATCHFVNVELGGQLQFYAPINSPTFTGVPAAPTPAPGTNSTQLATAAFVTAAIAAIPPPGMSITVGDTAPASPADNSLWWNSLLGQMFLRYNDGSSVQWVPASPSASGQTIPPGTVWDFAGSATPSGWYLCDGSLKNRTTDAALFAAIGTLYGAGDGSTTFAIPDCRGRMTVGVDPGGTAGRVTTALSGIAGQTVGATGGDQQMQVHAHGPGNLGGSTLVGNNLANGTQRAVGTGDGVNSGYYADTQMQRGATSNAGAGGGQNMPPTIVMNKMIKQ